MVKVRVTGGNCGFTTVVGAELLDSADQVALRLETGCPHVTRFGAALTIVDPMRESSYAGPGPQVLERARRLLPHPACPVPIATLKAIEVAAGLTLPCDICLEFTTSE